jgi:hypothetical protein
MAFLPAATIAAICLVAPAISVLWKLSLLDAHKRHLASGFSSFRPMGEEFRGFQFSRLSMRQKNGRHRCRPASGGEEKEILF